MKIKQGFGRGVKDGYNISQAISYPINFSFNNNKILEIKITKYKPKC